MDDGAVLRLFVALWPGPVTRRALADWQARQTWPAGARPVRPADLHVTLHFLGAVPAAQLPALKAALQAPSPRVTLALDRCSRWHRGTVVLEPLAVPEPLMALQQALGERLRALGLPLEDRPWRPHVTLARQVRNTALSDPLPALPWHSQGHVLALSGSGRGYQLLHRVGQ